MAEHEVDWAEALLEGNELAGLGPEARAGARTVAQCREQAGAEARRLGIAADRERLLLAALLFWNDHLEASHTLSQAIHTVDGSLLHGWMHRREPDYFNAKYWVRKTGEHPIFPALAIAVHDLVAKTPNLEAKLVQPNGGWNANGMVDAVEAALAGRKREWIHPLQAVQRMEVLLFLRGLG